MTEPMVRCNRAGSINECSSCLHNQDHVVADDTEVDAEGEPFGTCTQEERCMMSDNGWVRCIRVKEEE